MNWDKIVGHAGNIQILQNMLATGRFPHAMLFTGPAGIGKTLTARVAAAGLLCQGEGKVKPCGKCEACAKVAQGGHPDLVVLDGDAGSLKIDQIRGLQHEVALAPYEGGRRVFLIEDAERLTTQASNSLLKILEEPPPSSVFILTAASTYALLPTIVSRCRVLSFSPLKVDALEGLLRERGITPATVRVAARLGCGRVGRALAFAAPDGLVLRDAAAELAKSLASDDETWLWETVVRLDKLETVELLELLRNFIILFRDVLVIKSGQARLVFNVDIIDTLSEIADGWREKDLSAAATEVKQAIRALEGNANPRLTCEALLINLIAMAKEGKFFADSRRHSV